MNLRIQFKMALVLLMAPLLVVANSETTLVKTTKERKIKKTFNVDADATLTIDNSYGNLNVVTWNENRIEMEITIKVTGNSTEKVEKRLSQIDVKFSATNSAVSAETQFGNKKDSWWNWGSNNNIKVEVHYLLKMPITNNVDFSNDYGSINLDTLEGHAKLSCDYGKITTKELMADNNIINFDYSSSCYFEYIKSGKINADYSGFTVSKTKDLDVNADYTKSIIEVAENVTYNCDYGSLKLDNINNLNGNGDYLTLRLGNVFKNVQIKADYGSIKIDRLAAKAENLAINSDFTGITIGFDADYNFNFDLEIEYGSLKNGDDFNFTSKELDSSKKKYTGYFGSPNSGNSIKINSEYGSISFKKL